jgi:hypothetical protein
MKALARDPAFTAAERLIVPANVGILPPNGGRQRLSGGSSCPGELNTVEHG